MLGYFSRRIFFTICLSSTYIGSLGDGSCQRERAVPLVLNPRSDVPRGIDRCSTPRSCSGLVGRVRLIKTQRPPTAENGRRWSGISTPSPSSALHAPPPRDRHSLVRDLPPPEGDSSGVARRGGEGSSGVGDEKQRAGPYRTVRRDLSTRLADSKEGREGREGRAGCRASHIYISTYLSSRLHISASTRLPSDPATQLRCTQLQSQSTPLS
jgi:hypothetical protein